MIGKKDYSNCKNFATRLCPNRRDEALSAIENLVSEGNWKSHTHEVFEKGKMVCTDCKSFEPKKKEKRRA